MATNTESVVVSRDYIDNFSFKETAFNTLGPKYFEDIDVSKLNVGATGFTLEQIGNITEDTFNTSSILIKETFPNRAQIPDSIYSNAAIFQLDNTLGHAATCRFLLMISKEDIVKYGNVTNGILYFYIDKNTEILVEEIPFTFDYDIEIRAKKYQGKYVYSAQYIIDSDNSVSSITDPYLKIRNTTEGFLLLDVTLHQCERTVVFESIISNTKVNFPIINVTYDGMLCGFDVFYKAPSDTAYTQLSKKISFSPPSKTPFCYYKQKNSNTLSLSFTSRDSYFQPEFNSELMIRLYTTLGVDGNFDSYDGNNISFVTYSDVYEYNGAIAMTARVLGSSVDGASSLSLEALQKLTVEGFSTSNELSTEHDIELYYYNFKYRYGTELKVLKSRDDATGRRFSTFMILRDDDYIYPTNTLNLKFNDDMVDINYQNEKYIIKPGHIFTYDGDSKCDVNMVPDVMAFNIEDSNAVEMENMFAFTNPFLISITKSPNLVGVYRTIVNDAYQLDFIAANEDSFIQFILGDFNIYRGLSDDGTYKFGINVIPSAAIEETEIEMTSIAEDLRIVIVYEDNAEESGFTVLTPSNITSSMITYMGSAKTDDFITSKSKIKLIDAIKSNEESDYVYTPISGAIINIYALYKSEGGTNKFSEYDPSLEGYTVTNIYSTKSNPVTFIEPMNMIHSTVTFDTVYSDENDNITKKLGMTLSLLPMIKHSLVNESESFATFIKRFALQYDHLNTSINMLRNNTSIDTKFYNTYGRSINYYVGDDNELIDRVNLRIKFKIVPTLGADTVVLKRNLKMFIKNIIESLNDDGANDIYISNLIRLIEMNFTTVDHLKFLGINDYSTDYQTVTVRETDMNNLTKDERRKYVPELLVIDDDDILLSIEES